MHMQAYIYVLGICWGSLAGMTCKGQISDLVILIFGLAAEHLISNVSLNKTMLQRPVNWARHKVCVMV